MRSCSSFLSLLYSCIVSLVTVVRSSSGKNSDQSRVFRLPVLTVREAKVVMCISPSWVIACIASLL